VARFPEEQAKYVAGWQNYYKSYGSVFSALETRLREKLAKGN